jgi:hypothetical protein
MSNRLRKPRTKRSNSLSIKSNRLHNSSVAKVELPQEFAVVLSPNNVKQLLNISGTMHSFHIPEVGGDPEAFPVSRL